MSLSNNYNLFLENIPESELDYGSLIRSGDFADVYRFEYSTILFEIVHKGASILYFLEKFH